MIFTVSNRYVDPFHLHTSDIELEDIAMSLSLTPRFGGHLRTNYTIAEHSLHVHKLAKAIWDTREVCLGALLHDAWEAYFCDVPGPLKHLVQVNGRNIKDVEDMNLQTIFAAFEMQMNNDAWNVIKLCDRMALVIEARDLKQIDLGQAPAEVHTPVYDRGGYDTFIANVNTYLK